MNPEDSADNAYSSFIFTTGNGSPIECCNRDQINLQPRFHHPLCAPILAKDKYGFPNCLNYVRSALAVGETCNFGAAEQVSVPDK